MGEMSKELKHFLERVRVGRYPGASSSEKYARCLVDDLLTCRRYLDDQAARGLAEFVALAVERPAEAEGMLR
jgi:hypothetical protein